MKLDGVNDQAQLNSVLYHDNSALATIKHATDQHAALKTVAGQFEAMFLQLVLRQMRSSSDTLADKDSPFSSQQQGVFRDMYDGQLAIELAKKQRLGIADMLVQQLDSKVSDLPSETTVGLSSANDEIAPVYLESSSQNDRAALSTVVGPINVDDPLVASVNQKRIQEVNATSAFTQPLIRKMER